MSTDAQGQDPQQLFASLWENRGDNPSTNSTGEPQESQVPSEEKSEESPNLSPMEQFEQFSNEEAGQGESEEDNLAASEASEESELSLPSQSETVSQDSELPDIEEKYVKGPEGRKQKVKINYSDRKAIKDAYLKAAGMRKYQVERDAQSKLVKPIETVVGSPLNEESVKEIVSRYEDYEKIEKAYQSNGVKGIAEVLGGDEVWQKAVDEELAHRDYVSNLTAEEKYQLEMQKRDEQYKKQLESERTKREEFQKQVEAREEQAELQKFEAKLHPAFDRYRFAGKLGDTQTENLYDQAIWSQVQKRLGEYPETLELNQAIIDKEFRTVSNMFKKHIKTQAEKQVKKTVESKKAETAQRARVAAKKGLSGSTQERKIMQSLKNGNLGDALSLWKSGS